MKIGVYIPGLGQSFSSESLNKYVERFTNELKSSNLGVKYTLKIESTPFAEEKESKLITIYEKQNEENVPIYRFYEFRYIDILVTKFKAWSVLTRNLWLLLLVLRKFPLIIYRVFYRESYSRPWQIIYVFGIFLILSLSVLLLIPATIAFARDSFQSEIFLYIKTILREGIIRDYLNTNPSKIKFLKNVWNEFKSIYGHVIFPVVNILILALPNANLLLTSLAAEFVCANDYLEQGRQKQVIQGYLERLIDKISEDNENAEIHFHTYSFGSLVALDFLFPYSSSVSKNTKRFVKGIITIGTPVEFIEAYYPTFFEDRTPTMESLITWLNVYSVSDALATNFRNDTQRATALFGIKNLQIIPTNINFEVVKVGDYNIWQFLTLVAIKAHSMYWDSDPNGQSCLREIVSSMENKGFLKRKE